MYSVHRQISLLTLITSTITLVLAAAAFSTYEYTHLRRSHYQQVETLVDAVSLNAVGALSFVDPDAALDALATLSTNSMIKYAFLEDAQDLILAEYGIELHPVPKFSEENLNEVHQGSYRWYKKPIYFQDSLLGHLYLAASTAELKNHLIRLLGIAAAILCLCLLVALGLSRRLPRSMMLSLTDMTNVFNQIAKTKDYSERAVATPYKEFNTLTDSLNGMLEALSGKDRELQLLANYDSLTKLPNRHMFLTILNRAVEVSRRQNFTLAVFFIDLDHFKHVNDALGHKGGDEFLQWCAYRLGGCVRASDTLARLGGDEFVLLAQNTTDTQGLSDLADKLISVLLEPVTISGHEVSITASIGIAVYPDHGETPAALLKNADTAMYRAKNNGRNHISFYERDMDAFIGSTLEMENHLRNALKNDEFYLTYQPKLSFTTNRVDSVEALLRWHNQEIGSIGPNVFIPLAEELGLIRSIGQWVLEQSCEQIAKWHAEAVPISKVAVNISSIQFEDDNFVHMLDTVFAKKGVTGSSIELELTENVLMNTNEQSIKKLNQIHERGIEIAIDDFGTGYSSLQYLSHLPIDCLKIDRSFINGMENDDRKMTIVKAILAMGKGIGVKIVAEGIEKQRQEDLLRMLGCDSGQGYLYSKPISPEEMPDFLKMRNTIESRELSINVS